MLIQWFCELLESILIKYLKTEGYLNAFFQRRKRSAFKLLDHYRKSRLLLIKYVR